VRATHKQEALSSVESVATISIFLPSILMPRTFRPLLAEAVGTFLLALAVGSSGHTSVPTPLVAGLTLMTLVYIFGPVSGAHMNPAVTMGLYSIGSIKAKDALLYIASQLVGATIALNILRAWSGLPAPDATIVPGSIGEILGALVLAFGVTTVVQGKVPAMATGLAIGGSLFTGVLAAGAMSAGVLNPAVALGVGALAGGSVSWLVYLVMPLVGGVLGAQFAKYLQQ
jgi:glycerol uptake facilitator-like aquaporin